MSRKKYVVESAFESVSVQKIMQIAIDANGRIVNWIDAAENIKELNSDYINEHFGGLLDTAYQSGLKNGRKDGLIEAWELMKKIAFAQDPHVMVDVFGAMTFGEILLKNTPQEAIAKLKAYEEQKADDEIKVGDEVAAEDGTAVFVVTWMSENCICGVDREGKCYSYEPIEVCGKTGRRYDIVFSDIARGEDNEN